MDAVDAYIPQPDASDRQAVPDAGRRRVLDLGPRHGRRRAASSAAIVKVGDEVEIVGITPTARRRPCTGVEMFRKLLDQGQAGDNVGALLRGIEARGRRARPGAVPSRARSSRTRSSRLRSTS
jgi:elongation factor Tu